MTFPISSRFLDSEKLAQVAFKAGSTYLTEAARGEGVYRGLPRPFCLPRECAEENLYTGIRSSAIEYFSVQHIQWHNGQRGKPSNHMCSSQVACVNFLYPFANQPRALANLMRPVFPGLAEMLPIEGGRYVAFEWIGQRNYLGERVSRHAARTRGANCTSADAAVCFKRTDGLSQTVLIEWKYTESYPSLSCRYAKSGTDRTAIYRPLYERDDCPIRHDPSPTLGMLFYEPFYQMLRQQLLAHEMECAHELGAGIVSVLHIAPACNLDFCKITSPYLAAPGASATGVWAKLVQPADRFTSVSTEQLFGWLTAEGLPGMGDWLAYIHGRYPWVQGQTAGPREQIGL